jgi:hypothetical protein
MTKATPSAKDTAKRWNRDEDLKPSREGEPPRPASEPHPGAAQNPHTVTDPATGEPRRGDGASNRA